MKLFIKKLFSKNSRFTINNLKNEFTANETIACDNPKCENYKITGKVINTLLIGMLIH